MNEEQYLESRLEDQLRWYSEKSKHNQSWFIRYKVIEISSAALIPFLSGFSEKIPYSSWIIGILGLLVAITASLTMLFKYHENWIQYRTTAEQLKHEKYIYLTGTQPYNTKDKFNLLVERAESLISKENTEWAASSRKSGVKKA